MGNSCLQHAVPGYNFFERNHPSHDAGVSCVSVVSLAGSKTAQALLE